MRILVAGKGGVGKTTVSALLAYELAEKGYSVLALDTDSVPNLAQSLGIPYEEAEKIIPLSKNEELAEKRTGARPGEGWGTLFSLTPKVNDIADSYGLRISKNLNLVVVGSIDQGKEGCLCPAIALARAFLRHVLLKKGEVIVVDCEAGAEVFGRGLAEKFDVMLCISEPTYKSLRIARKLLKMGRELSILRSFLVINKVQDEIIESLYERVFKNDNIPLLALPFDAELRRCEEAEGGVNSLPRGTPLRKGIEKIVSEIMEG